MSSNLNKQSQKRPHEQSSYQQPTLQTLSRRLQKMQFISAEVSQKQLRQQKKLNEDHRLHLSRLQQRTQNLERTCKNNDQTIFDQKKEISQLRDRNQELKRFYQDLKASLERVIRGNVTKNSQSNEYRDNINDEEGSKLPTRGIGGKIGQPKLTNSDYQQFGTGNPPVSRRGELKKQSSHKSLSKHLKVQMAERQIKINSAMNMITQWARSNYRMNLQNGCKNVEKVSQGQGNNYIQLIGMEEFSKFGTSSFMVRLLKTQQGNIKVGIVSENAKMSKNDQANSILLRLGTGQVLVQRKWKKIGKRVEIDSVLTVSIQRTSGLVVFNSEDIEIAKVELPESMLSLRLYPKIEMFHKGDCMELL